MKHLIIGMGEVGKALWKLFPSPLSAVLDKVGNFSPSYYPGYDVIHICFPYSDSFVEDAITYKKKYGNGSTILIIHSSVPVGTTNKIPGAVYSPIRGVHPNLEKGIRTFVKYFAGARAHEAAQLFIDVGITCRVLSDTRTLEAAKLWDTTIYGLQILIEKEVWAWCRENKVDFELAYREFTQTYNEGYAKLGMQYVARPYLMHADGKIGGHCVMPNAALLDAPAAKRLIKENAKL